jgi:divalent metal cation (Fe/Co/Zn/Cd) transporter
VKKIIHPGKPSYSLTSLLIIAVAVVVKIALGSYVKKQGERVNSGSLIASGSDALSDALLSGSVLLCAILFKFTGLSLEPYVGAVIALFIIKSGVEMMTETLDDILGARADSEKTNEIKKLLVEEPEVRGAFDLVLYNYGPDRDLASVHLELPDVMTVREVDALTRRAEAKVMRETGVILAGVGVYSYNTTDDEAAKIRDEVRRIVMAHDWAVQFHGFYIDLTKKFMTFDVVMSFDIRPAEGLKTIRGELEKAFPDYSIDIAPDVDVSVTD